MKNLVEKSNKKCSRKKLEVTLESRDIEWEKRLINKQFEENFSTNSYDNDLLKNIELEKVCCYRRRKKTISKTFNTR